LTSGNRNPVSIIIPVYNDPNGIRTTLNSLSELDTEYLNVIVVDNGSTDDTGELVEEFSQSTKYVECLSESEIQGSYAARNKGVVNSRWKVLAFIDAGESVKSSWLKTALEAMQDQDADYLGCNVELTLSKDTHVGRYNAHTGFPVKQYLDEQNYAPTCALLVKREVFEDVGLFDARLISGGDREFGERVHEAGYKQGYAEGATVYHPARTSFESLAKKNFRVGRGFCQKQRYYPERYGKPGIPPTPSGPSGGDDEDEPDSPFTRLAFAFLSFAMLACRGAGYYYECFFGETRNDIPTPKS
jgi:glycosyltransferase involved in cell wall biosynthesis